MSANFALMGCGDVDVFQLSHTFTKLYELRVLSVNGLMYSAECRSLEGMKTLRLSDCEVKLREWEQLCPRLSDLMIDHCEVSWADVHVSPWQSLHALKLRRCDNVSLCRCTQLCPNLTRLQIYRCEVCVDYIYIPWQLLHALELNCCNNVSLCQYRQLCPNLTDLKISSCEVCVDDLDSQWQSLQTLWLLHSCLVQGGRRLSKKEAKRTLTDIWPSAAIHIENLKTR